MRRLVVWNVMTLDGYFEGKSPWDLGFLETIWGDELEAFSLEQGREIGTLLFGRRTYEGMASHWATATGVVADMMNSVEKAVATRTLDKATWNTTRLLKGDAVEAVRGLKAEDGSGAVSDTYDRNNTPVFPFRPVRSNGEGEARGTMRVNGFLVPAHRRPGRAAGRCGRLTSPMITTRPVGRIETCGRTGLWRRMRTRRRQPASRR
ncbi:hypothetical protein V1277_000204 [Bradyrhizobium sp. AZCC 1588]|uniref:dihydrofolate reductase family protein n=1 Tax=unclassified Bradyrhizobium TaxID=2631580 RepID=UPI002FEEA969